MVVDSASGPSDLIAKIPVARPDIIVTDFAMPGDSVFGDGLKLIAYLTRTFPGVKLLVLTMLTNPIIVSALYDAGVPEWCSRATLSTTSSPPCSRSGVAADIFQHPSRRLFARVRGRVHW
ncbi:response regulator [Cupriavidus basilensis]